jgi:hypothetical protein
LIILNPKSAVMAVNGLTRLSQDHSQYFGRMIRRHPQSVDNLMTATGARGHHERIRFGSPKGGE